MRRLRTALRRNAIVISVAVLVPLFVLLVMSASRSDVAPAAAPEASVRGVVEDETGRPVSGAHITMGTATTTSTANGEFSLESADARIAVASKAGHLSRTVVLEPGRPRTLVLTAREDETLSLRFGGDVMAGRRFYEDGPGRGPLLPPSSGAKEHAALLRHVAPLLKDADLMVVNLETPLMEQPYFDPTKPRPERFHPTKELAFGTDPAMALGLRQSGVDVVSLGNNHVMDGLDPGLESTTAALDEAGVAHFGAGRTEDEAWEPAYVNRRGQTVAFIGCTTVDGADHEITYVAGADRPGAARCDPDRLKRAVTQAKKRTDTIVFMPHGAVEYRRQQVPQVRELADVARRAGASMVVAHHPHVVGGLVGGEDFLFAESMGNLLFDQSLWETFPSYLVRADVRDGRPVSVIADPVVIDDFLPRPATGPYADAVSRIAAGSVPGAARVLGTGAGMSLGAGERGHTESQPLESGQPKHLAPGWWVDHGSSTQDLRWGSDLLYGTGSFESVAIPASATGERLWTLGEYAKRTSGASCEVTPSASGTGLQLARTPLSKRDAVAANAHRLQVGHHLSLVADVRRAAPGSALEVRWYRSAKGGSLTSSRLDLPSGSWAADECRSVRLDLDRPKGAKFAQVYVRQTPPDGGQRVERTGVDNVRLVQWSTDPSPGRAHDTVEATRDMTVTVRRDDPHGSTEPFLP